MPKNTILNYFQKKKPTNPDPEPKIEQIKEVINDDDDDMDEPIGRGVTKKKRPRPLSDSEDDDDVEAVTKREPIKESPKEKRSKISIPDEEGDSPRLPTFNTPKSTPKRTPKLSSSTPKTVDASPKPERSDEDGEQRFPHLDFDFLTPEKIRDSNGNRPDHPDYDPSSLKVPRSFLDQQTPAQRQWWVLKSENFDTLLFFKMGKFYELFHMDALIAIKECNLLIMKKDYAHCGFPEAAFQRYANILIDKGFKVARIEQVETPKMMEERCKKMQSRPTKFDKVVQRKICEKVSVGTRTFSEEGAADDYLVAVCDDKKISNPTIGLCVLNSSLCKMYVGQFVDDAQLVKLHTFLTLVGSAEIISSKSSTSPAVQKLLSGVHSIRKNQVKMPDVLETLHTFKEKAYFVDEENKENSGKTNVPEALKDILDIGCGTASMSATAFALVVNNLQDGLLDDRIFAFKEIYGLEDLSSSLATGGGKNLILFGHTLRNLDILPSEANPSYNLFTILDHTTTAFGRRMLKHMICNPLFRAEDVVARQEALKALHNIPSSTLRQMRKRMQKMCDFDKVLAWIFASCLKKEDHPEGEAIIYESDVQAKRGVSYLINCLNGFESAAELLSELADHVAEASSVVLKALVNQEEIDNLRMACQVFKDSFDFDNAASSNVIIPAGGVDPVYDEAQEAVVAVQKKAEAYRREQSAFFGAPIQYFGRDNNMYQLEVPENLKRKATKDYEISSQRKGFTRYLTQECKDLREETTEAEELVRKALKEVNRNMFLKFHRQKLMWKRVVQTLATLDCLLSFHEYSYALDEEESTFPTVTDEGQPFLKVTSGRHPLMVGREQQVIPNDVELDQRVFLLTGANMGGKSTVMRQTAILVVLAQLGCKVPAQEMSLLTVDRLFSRMGAQDNIMEGESTFFVELLETANILKHATPRSMAIIDELGRGTSTHDGCAIASAVIEHFALDAKTACRVMFTTHYHQLMKKYVDSKKVRLFHMAMIEPKEDSEQKLIFLYKVAPGSCPKSHGFNAALCAGIDAKIVAKAKTMANCFEQRLHLN